MLDELFLLNGLMNISDSIPRLEFLDMQGYIRRMKKLSAKFDYFLEHVIDEHNKRRWHEGSEFMANDMVDVLLLLANKPDLDVKLERHGVKAFTQDLMAGGIESSAVTMEWAISELLKRLDIFEKAKEELDRVANCGHWVEEKDVPWLPFVKLVVPLLVPHLAREDASFNGYNILVDTHVLVSVWTISRNSAVWDAPEKFCSKRFLGGHID
ncbi:hypothetical protein Cni_G02802 [Canna indica]|uniref:Uncharacterized protein n=1 Tax=Canna indica TaxID=4628 RepID=A0AAQ3JTD5_9LILI|nr:hypothetical protein Cni_G02802 [Canna indica]